MPQANSTTSRPRLTSPLASETTLPCSSETIPASSSRCRSMRLAEGEHDPGPADQRRPRASLRRPWPPRPRRRPRRPAPASATSGLLRPRWPGCRPAPCGSTRRSSPSRRSSAEWYGAGCRIRSFSPSTGSSRWSRLAGCVGLAGLPGAVQGGGFRDRHVPPALARTAPAPAGRSRCRRRWSGRRPWPCPARRGTPRSSRVLQHVRAQAGSRWPPGRPAGRRRRAGPRPGRGSGSWCRTAASRAISDSAPIEREAVVVRPGR